MSCRFADLHLRADLDAAERGGLLEHAEDCAACKARLELLEAARGAAVAPIPELSDAAAARWWAGIEAARAPRWRALLEPRWSWGAAAAAVALLLAIITLGLPRARHEGLATLEAGSARAAEGRAPWAAGEALPRGSWLELAPGSVLRVPGGVLEARTALLLSLPERPEAQPIRVARGALSLGLDEARSPRPLVTEVAALAFTAGRYLLAVDEGGRLHLEVERGEARLETASGAIHRVAAGQSATVAAQAAATAPELSGRRAPAPEAPEVAKGRATHALEGSEAPRAVEERGEGGVAAAAATGPARARPGAAEGPPASSSPPAEPPPAELAPPSAPRSDQASDRRALAEARALVRRDAPRATAIAEDVLARSSEAPIEAEALMVAADGWRRRGEAERAAGYYQRALEHPGGAGFAEEAALRRAELLITLGRGAEARPILAAARRRFGDGGLAPERAAALAGVLLGAGEAEAAASVLEEVGAHRDRVLDAPRLEVARALLAAHPARARALAQPLLERPGPVGEEAAAITSDAARRKKANAP